MKLAEWLYQKGLEKEKQGELEAAFQKYKQGAALHNSSAMMAIARLYLSGEFRPVKASSLTNLLLQSHPIFPWNPDNKMQPDYKSTLEWLTKAADCGSGTACEIVGNMLCTGIGCEEDVEKGIRYLEKAAGNGQASAKKYICLYRPDGKTLTDEEYELCLADFAKAADAGDDKAYELYATLKSGSPKQLARLGYLLIAAQNVQKAGYEAFRYSFTPSGIPLLPVASKRGAWRTFLRFNLDAWNDKYPLIAVASDILKIGEPSYLLSIFHRARIVGTARYRSPAFGWLREEKDAILIRLGDGSESGRDAIAEVAKSFALIEEEYLGDSIAFMVENGEKEYCFEVAGINGDRMDVLWRYTIGGTDYVREYFEPEIISMDITS